MQGRFFTAPFLVSIALLGRVALPPKASACAAAALTIAIILAPARPWESRPAYGMGPEREITFHGIADERAVYYPYTGLLRMTRDGAADEIHHPWVDAALRAKAAGPSVVVFGNVGFFGYFAGREVHFVDPPALVDPLLARLPASPKPDWRIGHFDRAIPDGYVSSLASGAGAAAIADPSLREYDEHLRAIVRGPIFDRARLLEVLRMNLGAYQHLLPHNRALALNTTPR